MTLRRFHFFPSWTVPGDPVFGIPPSASPVVMPSAVTATAPWAVRISAPARLIVDRVNRSVSCQWSPSVSVIASAALDCCARTE